MSGNVIREILKLTQEQDVLSFAGGLPSPDSFPTDAIRPITDDLFRQYGTSMLQYATTEGYPPLREAIASWVRDRGIEATSDNVTILSGSQQGLDLICKAYVNPGDTVIVESPSYLAFLEMLKMFEARPIHVESDEEGMDPELLEDAIKKHRPKLIYLIPTYRNPTGETISLERRQRIVDIAARYDVMIVEDDPYGCLRFEGDVLPAVRSFGYSGSIYLGSFSKIVAPGLRIGYAIADPQILRPLVIAKQGADIHSSNVSQMIIAEFFARDLLDKHIREISQVYASKRDTMLAAMEEHFPAEATMTRPNGGLFIWAMLPEGISTTNMLEQAVEQGVAYIPGTPFHADGQGDHAMRLNFSNASHEELRIGIQRLAHVIQQTLEKVSV